MLNVERHNFGTIFTFHGNLSLEEINEARENAAAHKTPDFMWSIWNYQTVVDDFWCFDLSETVAQDDAEQFGHQTWQHFVAHVVSCQEHYDFVKRYYRWSARPKNHEFYTGYSMADAVAWINGWLPEDKRELK